MGQEYQQQLDDLFRKIGQLEAVVRSQQQIIESQQRTIEAQQERIKELESVLAAAKKNSSNSSKPPSSDIVKPKKNGTDKDNNDANSHDGNNKDGDTSGQRKRGGQKGHPGYFRQEFTADQIDEVFEYTLTHSRRMANHFL